MHHKDSASHGKAMSMAFGCSSRTQPVQSARSGRGHLVRLSCGEAESVEEVCDTGTVGAPLEARNDVGARPHRALRTIDGVLQRVKIRAAKSEELFDRV